MKRITPGNVVAANGLISIARDIIFVDGKASSYGEDRIGDVVRGDIGVVIAVVDDYGDEVNAYAYIMFSDFIGWRSTGWFDPVTQ